MRSFFFYGVLVDEDTEQKVLAVEPEWLQDCLQEWKLEFLTIGDLGDERCYLADAKQVVVTNDYTVVAQAQLDPGYPPGDVTDRITCFFDDLEVSDRVFTPQFFLVTDEDEGAE